MSDFLRLIMLPPDRIFIINDETGDTCEVTAKAVLLVAKLVVHSGGGAIVRIEGKERYALGAKEFE